MTTPQKSKPSKSTATIADAAAALGDNTKRDPMEPSNLGDAAPLVPPGAAPTLEEQMAAMQKQIAALLALQQGTLNAVAGVTAAQASLGPTDEQLQLVASAQPMPEAKVEPRIKIMLEDNDNVPPGGQFISVDGVAYLLQPNVEVAVPVSVLEVLDNATMSVPIVDLDKNVIGYRDRLRFPYRTIRERTATTED